MDSFLKFLEDDCPGDDAHSGFGDSKPLLERCGMCAAIYEAHEKAVAQATGELRETITRLNRRCQEAESAARVKVEEVQKAGPSLGRALAGWAAADYRRKYEEAQKEIEKLKEVMGKAMLPYKTCPSCGGECPYRNQDYVSHGYYCDPCHRTFSCDLACCKPKEAR